MPDARAFTIWDTIRATIEDPALTLHLVLDEAHRGMRENKGSDRPTIVRRLVNGQGAVPGIPIVWGISATPARFDAAMKDAKGRTLLPNVEVDAARVQASGLLKDVINLDFPKTAGQFDTVLVRRGVDKLKDATAAWAAYATAQGDSEAVVPLMVLQVPNATRAEAADDIADGQAPAPAKVEGVAEALQAIFERWPDLTPDSVAHVFGERGVQTFGGFSIPHVPPERVQERTDIRILLAKDAISTGWDCPRAEVMVSFRPASDPTHITQLLGRMLRSPLARRIPGNDRLNMVDCLLPFFDKATSERVADALNAGGEDGPPLPGRRVLINAIEMRPNPVIPEDVRAAMAAVPSQALARRQARPVKRLTALAHELASDGLRPDAGKEAHRLMHEVLDAIQERHAAEIAAKRGAVMQVEGQTLTAALGGVGRSLNDFVEAADRRAIDDAYQRTGRVVSPAVARSYCEHLAGPPVERADRIEALIEARVTIAALSLLPNLKRDVEAAAEKLGRSWLEAHAAAVKALSDERQDIYRRLQVESIEPVEVSLVCPTSRMQATASREANSSDVQLPLYPLHLLADEAGQFPDDLNRPERVVMKVELDRLDVLAWYRNPPTPSPDSLGIRYEEDAEWKIMRPDFLIFTRQDDGSVGVSIVDPHGDHLADALPRLRGLAAFAELHGDQFARIDAVGGGEGPLMVLGLKDPKTRQAVAEGNSARSVFKSVVARPYWPQ